MTQTSGSDLGTRFAAGIAMIAVAVVAIYVGGWLFRLLVAAGAAVMIVEWGDMHRVNRVWSWAAVAGVLAAVLGAAQWLYPVGEIDVIDGVAGVGPGTFDDVWIGFGIVAAAAAIVGLLSRRLSMGWGSLYIGVPSFALLVLEWARFDLVFWLMLVTWSTDIFAYFAGRAIGGPKLAPGVSPNKTWAGLGGGVVAAAILGAAAAVAFDLPEAFAYVGAPMGLLAQLGDLFESWVKRRAGVKDSGSILPGHGGVLDRVDGLLPVAVATLALIIAVPWSN